MAGPRHHGHQAGGHPAGGRPEHETFDVPLRPLLLFVVGLIVSAVVVHVGLGGLMQWFDSRQSRMAGLPSPVPPPIRSGVEAPPLQGSPHDDLIKMRREERAILDGSAATDPKAGLVRIPIEAAMRLVVERGLPTRTSADTTSEAGPREPEKLEEPEPSETASGRRP